MTREIAPEDLLPMNDFAITHPLRIDLVYADAAHPENIFRTALYRDDARLYLHRDFAPVVLRAALFMQQRHGAILVLKDGLRPIEAQAAMQDTAIVRANPHWSDGPVRLLSKPGQGGHPRGMAVDVGVVGVDGRAWDMGTAFDALSADPDYNPAARDFTDLPQAVLDNRARLEAAFVDAAAAHNRPLLPLPSEWWDFRFPASVSEQYAPVSDQSLPPEQKMLPSN